MSRHVFPTSNLQFVLALPELNDSDEILHMGAQTRAAYGRANISGLKIVMATDGGSSVFDHRSPCCAGSPSNGGPKHEKTTRSMRSWE